MRKMDSISIWKLIGYGVAVIAIIVTAVIDFMKDVKEKKEKDDAISEKNEAILDAKTKGQQLEKIEKTTSEIKDQLAPFTTLALKLHPGENEDSALKKLADDIDNLSSELAKEKKTIKTLEATLKIKYSGIGPNYHVDNGTYFNGTCRTYLRLIDKTGKHKDIEFCCQMANKSEGVFDNVLSVKPGSAIQGQLLTVLKNYDQIEAWIPLTSWTTSDSKITLNEVTITFSINGINKGEFISDHPYIIDTNNGPFKPVPKADGLLFQPMVIIDQNIYSLLKL